MTKQGYMKSLWDEMMEACDTYVICSTLNQVVNYLPYKMIKNAKTNNICIRNITYKTMVDDSNDARIYPRFHNNKWDENFQSVVKNEDIKNILLSRDFNQGSYKDSFAKALKDGGHTILWNLTGGQRSVLLAAQNFIEQDENKDRKHMIFYLEGNTQRIIAGTYMERRWTYAQLPLSYEDSTLTIKKLFSLAGFEATPAEEYLFDEDRWVINEKGYNENDVRKRNCAYINFFEKYKENKDDLLKKMVSTNSKGNEAQEALFDILDSVKLGHDSDINCIKKSLTTRTNMPFGYLLEYMALAVIIKEITTSKYKNYFRSVGFDVSVEHNKKEKFCQLDIVLTLKSGQAVFFECKSGGMKSEVGKAREYTAYALGGVYGKPILITPLSERNITASDKQDEYKRIYEATDAASRAGLDICCLDSLGKDLEVIFRDLFSKLGGD